MFHRQAKTEAFVNSGVLPEYKKWIDPTIIERDFQAREQRLQAQEQEKAAFLKKKEQEVARTLQQQMKEREMMKQTVRRKDEEMAKKIVDRAAEEEAREQAKRVARAQGKQMFRAELDRQMKENVMRRRNQPISEVERALNKELLDKVGTWKSTGRVDVGA